MPSRHVWPSLGKLTREGGLPTEATVAQVPVSRTPTTCRRTGRRGSSPARASCWTPSTLADWWSGPRRCSVPCTGGRSTLCGSRGATPVSGGPSFTAVKNACHPIRRPEVCPRSFRCLAEFFSMRRMDFKCGNTKPLRVRHSQSSTRPRQRFSQSTRRRLQFFERSTADDTR